MIMLSTDLDINRIVSDTSLVGNWKNHTYFVSVCLESYLLCLSLLSSAYAVVTCEIKLFWNNSEIISCNHVWNQNKIISATERVLKLFQHYFSNIQHVKYSWAAISLWNDIEIISSKLIPSAEIKSFQTDVDEGWNNFISHVTTTLDMHNYEWQSAHDISAMITVVIKLELFSILLLSNIYAELA